MCIAIYHPKGKELTKEALSNCWVNNYNGGGFMYNNSRNQLVTVKEMDKFETFYAKYVKAVQGNPTSSFVLHFRISTHGVITKENCHPFKVNTKLGFVHNGVISAITKDKTYSDTNMFNRMILKKIPNISINYLKNKAIKDLIQSFIGASKLIFMDNENKFVIIGEEKGHWNEGCWFSNDSYKEVKKYIDYGGTKVMKKSTGYAGYAGYTGSNAYSGSKDYLDKWGTVYKISTGDTSCKLCGCKHEEGEVTNQWGDCMKCATALEVASIEAALKRDGYTTSEINIKPKKACDWCGCAENISFEKETQSNLCEECLKVLTTSGVIK